MLSQEKYPAGRSWTTYKTGTHLKCTKGGQFLEGLKTSYGGISLKPQYTVTNQGQVRRTAYRQSLGLSA